MLAIAMKTKVMKGVARKIKAYIRGPEVEGDSPTDMDSNVDVADITTYKM
jgi:hypothetical protein